MLKLNQIKQKTDPGRINRATDVLGKLETVVKLQGPAPGKYIMEFLYKMQSGTVPGIYYNVIFRTLSNNLISNDNGKALGTGMVPLTVNCSCDDFKYRWEAVLGKKDASRRMLSNGEMPNVTNPDHKTAMCKHCVSALNLLKQYINRTNFDNIGVTTNRHISPKNLEYADRLRLELANRKVKNRK